MGEMEKDALIAHGASSVLDDRARVASDAHTATICTECGHVGDSRETTLRTRDVDEDFCRKCDAVGTMVMLPTTYCYANLLIPEMVTCGICVDHKFTMQ